MNVNCNDRDRIFEDGTPSEWAAFEAHAGNCRNCAAELSAWRSLSLAASELRDYSANPTLWPRIRQSLAEQAAVARQRTRWNWRSLSPNLSLSWQAATAVVLVLLLMLSAGWLLRPAKKPPLQSTGLLKSRALADVESAESVYVQAIDKLATEAKPQLEAPGTALMANYREKLLVLDSAIDDLRAQTGQNPSNAHLRYELLAMYQEKQRTLEEILEEKR
jgi:anti-sigma-K factor RskA